MLFNINLYLALKHLPSFKKVSSDYFEVMYVS